MEKEPEISYEGNYALIKNVKVNLEMGLCARPSAMIAKECLKYNNGIFFNPSVGEENRGLMEHHGDKMIEVLALDANPGKNLDIVVENIPGTNPEKILKRLYSGLTTDDFYPDFERLEE
jgi:phosphotransferase system HPr-like phosphotransfer protein